MSHTKRMSVPDRLYQEAFYLAKEHGLSDEAAQWEADMTLDRLLQTPDIPKERDDEAQ